MFSKRKPLDEQVIVITGASSGIGLTAAKMAANKGARVMLCARTEPKLQKIVDELQAQGHEASYAVADVADLDQVEHVARLAEERYGGIDTWVNNAGISIFGRIEDVDEQDARRLFETNFWGIANGCKAAIGALRRRGGGTIVNIGSVLSDHGAPLEGFYSASKHAVKGYTNALRMELMQANEPIDICLIKPASINTPYADHAKNLMDVQPTLPPPVYHPKIVADAILEAAVKPRRTIYVGGAARALRVAGNVMPRTSDLVGSTYIYQAQLGDPSPDAPWEGSLYEGSPDEEPSGEGRLDHYVMGTSLYTEARLHPFKALGVGLLGLGAAWALARSL